MKEYVWTFIFQIINLAVLYVVLRKLLFKPVKSFLDKRTQAFRSKKEELEKLQDQIDADRKLAMEELQNAREQVKGIIEQAEKTAKEQIRYAEEEAQKRADAILEQARRKAEDERMQAIETFKDQAAVLAVEMASKIIKNRLTVEENKDVIEKFLEKVELK